jgi:hypothetical protein
MRIAITLIGIVLLVLSLSIVPFSETRETQRTCVSLPDATHTVIYDGKVYRRIRTDTPIFYGEISTHLTPTTPAELFVDSKYRPSYVPWFDGLLENKYVTWRPLDGVNNLLFVDTTADRAQSDPGYRYYDIYLRPSDNNQYVMPEFIRLFCSGNFPIGRKNFFVNDKGNIFPPPSFNTKDLTWSSSVNDSEKPRPNTEYYIFSYESEGSASWNTTTAALWRTGELRLNNNGEQKRYKVYYVSGSILQYIALVDMDPQSPDAHIAYKYTFATSEFQPTFSQSVEKMPFPSKYNLQLETFNVPMANAWGWWSPECKPAIYLYPQQTMNIHVTVNPKGFLTYTDPLYPSDGWRVRVHPDGTFVSNDTEYRYLYYESKIKDDELEHLSTGYVVQFDKIPQLFSTILPLMGLEKKEIADFKTYWENALPFSPYYFVGVMPIEAIDRIEPLTISPKQDTIIRVRLYFEALNAWKAVPVPTLLSQKREGFTVVEWGGLVKVDKNHPFTCSQ